MFKLLIIVICVVDAVFIGGLTGVICISFFGNNPVGRLFKILAGLAAGIGYFILTTNILFSFENVNDLFAILIIFGPVAAILLLLLMNYVKGEK